MGLSTHHASLAPRPTPRTEPRRPRFLLALALIFVVLAGATLVPYQAQAASLRVDIAAILAKHHLTAADTSVSIWDRTTGRRLYQLAATAARVPASDLKLATSAAALSLWGPRHRFKTELYLSTLPLTPPAGIGMLVGNVYLKGYGDPSLSTVAYEHRVLKMTTATLAPFLTRLKALGVTCITGSVIADDSYFDRLRSAPGWRPNFEGDEIGALSALTINEGGGEKTPVMSSPLYAAATLTAMIEKAGIRVNGAPRFGTVAPGSVLVKITRSAPLAVLLEHMNKHSDNFFAEMLTKGLGASFGSAGTTAAGVRVVRHFLADNGLHNNAIRLFDGSGLSAWNRFSAADFTRLLTIMASGPDAASYAASLSIAGEDGTLRRRMRNSAAQNNLIGKTGTLSIASCLSGYVRSANHHRLVFSLLMNGSPVDFDAALSAQDAISVLLAKAKF